MANTSEDISAAILTSQVFFCQTPVQSLKSRLGVDFVFPLSQEHQEHQEPHQNIAEERILEVLYLTHRLVPTPFPNGH